MKQIEIIISNKDDLYVSSDEEYESEDDSLVKQFIAHIRIHIGSLLMCNSKDSYDNLMPAYKDLSYLCKLLREKDYK